MLSCLMLNLIISFFVAMVGTLASMYIARSFNAIDQPGQIKIHRQPIPRLGGLGIFLGTFISYSVLIIWGKIYNPEFFAVILGGLFIAITGFVDDIYNLRPWQKLLGQALGGLGFLIPLWGVFHTSVSLKSLLIYFLAFLFIIFMSNSFNLFDGMDGLAAGTSIIIGIFFIVIAFIQGQFSIVRLSVSLMGGALGFLVFNFPPARTFMGDVGSLFLGYTVAVIAIMFLMADFTLTEALGLLLIIALPITDTSLAIVRRFLSGNKIFQGDRFHLYDCLYHRFLNKNTWLTIILIWFLNLLYGGLGLYVMRLSAINAVIVSLLSILGLIIFAYKIGSIRGFTSQVSSSDVSEINDQTILY